MNTNYAYVNNTNKNKVSSKITVGEDTFDIKDVIDIKYTSIGNPDEHYDYSISHIEQINYRKCEE